MHSPLLFPLECLSWVISSCVQLTVSPSQEKECQVAETTHLSSHPQDLIRAEGMFAE